jgi:hypothetical protein
MITSIRKKTSILVKDGSAPHPRSAGRIILSTPTGWDGYSFHLPSTPRISSRYGNCGISCRPLIHQTWREDPRFMAIRTFAPRFFDTHPEAIKIPWVHD